MLLILVVVKICDFGFSEEFTKGDDLLEEYGGNSIYKPPETFEGNGYDGHLMDNWGASIVFIEMLTGDRPWKKRPDEYNSHLELLYFNCHYLVTVKNSCKY